MTYHIFTRGSELFVITERLPDKPPIYFGPHPKVDEYHAELSRLKESAIRVGNKWYFNRVSDLFVEGLSSPIIEPKEGELYPIDCEIDYEWVDGLVGITTVIAILKPLPPPAPPMGDLMSNVEDRNWTEDFSHENGKYINKCTICSHYFIGHKRRVICKKCDPLVKEEEQDELWREIKNKINGDSGRHINWDKTNETLKSKYRITRL